MNQLTMSDIQFNFSNVTIALQIGNDGKAQLTFTPTQTTELYANTVQHNSEPAVHAAPAAPAAPAVPQAPVIPAQQVVHTPAAPAAPAEAAANFLSGNTAIPAQPSAESVAQLVQQSAAIVQGAN